MTTAFLDRENPPAVGESHGCPSRMNRVLVHEGSDQAQEFLLLRTLSLAQEVPDPDMPARTMLASWRTKALPDGSQIRYHVSPLGLL